MARSLKKGPFADASLLKKVDAMNASCSRTLLDIQLQYTTEENMFLYM